MVCIPCFIVPVLLVIWHKFIQPYILRYWNPWGLNTSNEGAPIECAGGTCKWAPKKNKPTEESLENKSVRAVHDDTKESGTRTELTQSASGDDKKTK